MRAPAKVFALIGAMLISATLSAEPSLETGSVLEAAQRLRPGEYLWAPQVAPEGPVLLVISLATQRAVLYRNGVPIAITTVSTGRPGYRTPTGVFTVLERDVEHYSSLYNNAPMPYMQRLTWGGVALHGGQLPGYPASHGCIRLPHEFARLLFGVTRLGMTVIVTNEASVPRVAPGDTLFQSSPASGQASWHPERARSGPVSIVISAADRRLVVLRNGVVIGSAPVTIDAAIRQTSTYVLQISPDGTRTWLRVLLPGQGADSAPEQELRGQIRAPDDFRRLVEPILRSGTTVVITQDSLTVGARPATIVESDEGA